MSSPQTVRQIQKFAPKCIVCGRLATCELIGSQFVEYILTCGPFTYEFVYPLDPIHPQAVISMVQAIAEVWLVELRNNPEPVTISHRPLSGGINYCDTHVEVYKCTRPTQLSDLIRSIGQDPDRVSGLSRYQRPWVI
jgi:hypothetical protein